MISVDFTQNEFYPHWAANMLQINRNYFGNCRTITFWKKNNLLSVAVYSNYNGINCELTVAAYSKWWARKDVIKMILKYPFEQLGCRRVTLLVRDDNHGIMRLVKRFGFEKEGQLREFFEHGEDCLIFGMLKPESLN